MINDEDARFNDYMSEYLKKNINNEYSMVFIDAPGLGGEDNYLSNIIRCFKKAGIEFKNIIHVNNNTSKKDLEAFLEVNGKIVYFLTGGNPYTQLEIIKKLDMIEKIKKKVLKKN